MHRLFLRAVGGASLVSVLAGCGTALPPLADRMTGTWASPGCELGGTIMGFSLYYRREYTFTNPMWKQIGSIYLDQTCFFPAMVLEAKGTYDVGAELAVPMGASELNFTYTERKLTVNLPMLVPLLNMVMCGASSTWAAGVSKDIGAAGCAPFVPSNTSCPKEFDVVKLDETSLTLGQRPMTLDGLCTTRPASLASSGLTKK